MQNLLTKKGFLCDMDGVIYHGNRLLPGVQEFVAWLQKEHKKFLFLTNNSGKTQRELQSKLSRMGLVPACRALVAPIELATGKAAYYVGKPNPLMMRTGLNILGCHSQDTAIIGDRMDTDIVAGIECGLDTVLVLSGVTSREEIGHFPYRPRLLLKGVGEIPAAKGLPSAASACIIDKDPGQVPQGAPDSKGQPPCLKGAAK